MAYNKQQTELQRKQYQINKLKQLNKKIASKNIEKSKSKQSSVLDKSESDDFFGFFSFLKLG